jgi:hypothetical protein
MRVSLDDIDDPEFDVDTATLTGDVYTMTGLLEMTTRRWTGIPRVGRHAIRLRIADAHSFTIRDSAGIGVLIIEKITELASSIRIDGVMPCVLVVHTNGPSRLELDVDERPSFVRRRYRWVPAR